MKTPLLLISALLAFFSINAQSYDTCNDAYNSTSIGTGLYSVGVINGTLPPLFCYGDGASVETAEWFKYIPTSDHNITVSSDLEANGDQDTRLHIFSGTCGNLACVAGDDDSGNYTGANGSSYLAVVSFNVTAGNEYYIVWDNKWGAANFVFELTEAVTVTDPPVTFTQNNINTPGSYDRAIVDMNGDYLDDTVSISATKIFLNIQKPEGGFDYVEKTTTSANFTPSWSLAAGDYNADGYTDLLYGAGSGVTFMTSNQTGTSGFDSVQYIETSGPENVFSQRSNFVDINNDGNLDAFVCHDVAPSISYINNGIDNTLVFSNSNGLGDYYSGGNYASVWVDYDNDKDIDMFMAKCGGSEQRRTNQLYRNNGDGTYTEVGISAGLADAMQTWSAAWGDYDNDGDMDAYIGSSTGNDHKIMQNNGDGTFTDVSAGSGIDTANQGIENVPGDFNNDGFLDVLSNGSLLFGNGDLTFTVFDGPTSGSIGDANNDGFLDVFNGNIQMNNGNSNNWIKIVTVGDQSGGYSNINGIGARVEVHTANKTQIRDVTSGIGFRHMSTLNTHVGIGTENAIAFIRVYWPSGVIDTINNPAINDTLVVNEGSSTLSQEDTFVTDLILYPNPTKDILNISTINNLNDAFYTVFDINGKRVVNAKLNSEIINVSHLRSGNYILRISSGNSIRSQKFIKY